MNDLEKLAAALRYDRKLDFSGVDEMKKTADSLEKRFEAGEEFPESHDLLLQAVKAFWVDSQLHSVRQARLVSFALTLPVHSSGQCLMDDSDRFGCLLDGLKRLRNRPLEYRRCYQGLLHSYFSYDIRSDKTSDAGRINCRALRRHLHENHALLNCGRIVPDWAHAVAENLQVFGDDPCAPYAKVVLEGNPSAIDELCERLRITKVSWFWRELIIAQIRWSVGQERDLFLNYMPQLLELLRRNEILRNEGLTIILDHYASLPKSEINVLLRDTAVEFWGNPWLPSNKAHWGGVTIKAKDMISSWLKRHFIKEFFSRLARGDIGDPRRANFWLQYVDAIDKIEFALGSWALGDRDKDMQLLRNQMRGLTTELKGGQRDDNAFVMRIGDLVAVEFGDKGAFYGYEGRVVAPFDMSRPVAIKVDAENSLKRSDRFIWKSHIDNSSRTWEAVFSEEFGENFNIFPDGHHGKIGTSSKRVNFPINPPSMDLVAEVLKLAEAKGLVVEDLREKNGNLWIKTDSSDLEFGKLLVRAGFKYKFGKGWWK